MEEGRKEGETWIASLRYLVIFSVFRPCCRSCYALITPANRGKARNPSRIVDDKATFFFRGKVEFTWSVKWSVSFYIYLTVGSGKFAVPKRTWGAKMEKGKLSLWKIFGTDFSSSPKLHFNFLSALFYFKKTLSFLWEKNFQVTSLVDINVIFRAEIEIKLTKTSTLSWLAFVCFSLNLTRVTYR